MKDNSRQFYSLLFLLALAINFTGINVKFFTDDPGLYAAIAKNLIYRKDFLQLYTYNQDWLDKPHFPFWLVWCSFKLFGVSVWAYRLPALLFFTLGVLYTWLFTRKYYGAEIALVAALILMTSLSILMSNTDMRAEPYLLALVIGSIYHIARLEERFTYIDLLMTALLTACAVMTKGLFVLVAVYGGLLGQLLFQKKLKQLLGIKWLLLIVLTAIFILPECYALYVQFDAHPDKVVFGRQHVSGIRWFLWDSQFGRFINNGPITRKSGDVFFYLHTLLWAFAPWCLLFYYAVYKSLKNIYLKNKLPEYYAISGGLLLLLLFSLSRFQLPFYTNTIFPLFAIITAPYCCKQLNNSGEKFRLISQWVYIIAFPVLILVVNFFLHPANGIFVVIDCIVFGTVAFLIYSKIEKTARKVFMLNCTAALFVNFYLNTVFYNEIIPYKGQIAAAVYINQKQFDGYHLYSLRTENNIFQFYCKRPVDFIPLEQFGSFKPADSAAFYASRQTMDFLRQSHADFRVMRAFINYPQENILPAFIDKAKRAEVLDSVYLITKQRPAGFP